jgi:hypothetical protein
MNVNTYTEERTGNGPTHLQSDQDKKKSNHEPAFLSNIEMKFKNDKYGRNSDII